MHINHTEILPVPAMVKNETQLPLQSLFLRFC